jgi:hypothetical protein
MNQSVSFSSGEYLLFDGALLHGTEAHRWLLGEARAVPIYADLGETAAGVGPLLVPATPEAQTLAQHLATSGTRYRYACNRLRSRQSDDEVVLHLQQVRYLLSGADASPRLYFRYADGRALSSLWPALSQRQRACLLGPIESWESTDYSGQVIREPGQKLQPEEVYNFTPLHLQPEQWHQVLEADRTAGLHERTLTDALHFDLPGLVPDYPLTAQAYEWLRQRKIAEPAVQTAVTAAAWKTADLALLASPFEPLVARACENGAVAPVLVFAKGFEGNYS